eukprot:scaffold168624_cov15-Tisochrysis_lutea.AAC.1
MFPGAKLCKKRKDYTPGPAARMKERSPYCLASRASPQKLAGQAYTTTNFASPQKQTLQCARLEASRSGISSTQKCTRKFSALTGTLTTFFAFTLHTEAWTSLALPP